MKKIAAALALSLAFGAPAHAATAFLQSQWYEGGAHFCRYSNGTVLNVGASACPVSIG